MLVSASTATTTATGLASTSPSVAMIGLIFLKVGAVLYGSGYVLIAYLEGELVHQRGWLTSNELLDAIAIGQFTPGPILSTATFIGYLVMASQGPLLAAAGAVTATIGIFLPAFLLVGITSPWVSKLRSHRTLSRFLDAVNAASMGLMAAVVLKLGKPTLFPEDASSSWTTPCRLLIVGVAMILVFRYRVSPILVIASGLVLGLVLGQWLV
jgi:chromate transporter